jgi:hypothetical protein
MGGELTTIKAVMDEETVREWCIDVRLPDKIHAMKYRHHYTLSCKQSKSNSADVHTIAKAHAHTHTASLLPGKIYCVNNTAWREKICMG